MQSKVVEHVTPLTRIRARPTQPTETMLDSTPEYGIRCSPRVTGLSEDFTAQDIDVHLNAVPLPFDLSLSRHRTSSPGNGEGDEQSDESSLWWYHPIFEARAKADIRRTLSALLPSDPSQDPPSPLQGVAGWKAEVRPRQSGARIWAERLEDAFGPGPLDRGLARKPFRVTRPGSATMEQDVIGNSHPENDVDTEVVIANSPRCIPPRCLEPPSWNRSPSPEDVADEVMHPPDDDGMVFVEDANGGLSESEAIAQAATLPSLVKGKTTLNRTKRARFVDNPGEVDWGNERGSNPREVLETSVPTRHATAKRSRPHDEELMSKTDLPDWKRCAWCVPRKIKCIPRVGSQPPYQCFHCEDGERECIPYKKKDRKPSGALLRRHPRLAGPSHRKDIVMPAHSPEEYPVEVDRRTTIRDAKARLHELIAANCGVQNPMIRDAEAQLHDVITTDCAIRSVELELHFAKLESRKAEREFRRAKLALQGSLEVQQRVEESYFALLARWKADQSVDHTLIDA